MKKHYIYILVAILFSVSCKSTTSNYEKKPYIIATTGMIGDALKNICGNSIEIKTLMGPGVDPHLYKATEGDLNKINDASLIVYNGLHLEGKMSELFEKLSSKKAIYPMNKALNQSTLRKLDASGNTYDPHIWFDVQLWSRAVNGLSLELQKQFPNHKDTLIKRTKVYLDNLHALHLNTQKEINSIPEARRILITAHDAFGYFGNAYNIKVLGLQGISTVSEYGLKDITQLVDIICTQKIKAVFVETSVSQKAIQAVVEGCQAKGHKVKIGGTLYSDALGSTDTPTGNYIGMVQYNVKTIVSQLK
jgi:manganese/zinc/iron transport system substrate-binding protein